MTEHQVTTPRTFPSPPAHTSTHQHTPIREADGPQGWRAHAAAGAGVQSHAAMLEGILAASNKAEPSLTIHPEVLIDTDPTDVKTFIFVNPA